MELKKASRKQVKLRLNLSGASGSGKTYSALRMAYGMTGDWNKIAVIDTDVSIWVFLQIANLLFEVHKNYKKYLLESNGLQNNIRKNFSLDAMTTKMGGIFDKYVKG
mgnify:CR=1 FL=1